MSTAADRTVRHAGKYLALVPDNEAYGIAVLKAREIIRLQKITPVPQMPPYVKGVINLRGRVIPVVDLRVKFGLKAGFTERTCIVVTQVRHSNDTIVQMGLIVDAVEEVVNLTDAEIEPTPEFGAKVDTTCLLGMAKVKGQVKTPARYRPRGRPGRSAGDGGSELTAPRSHRAQVVAKGAPPRAILSTLDCWRRSRIRGWLDEFLEALGCRPR